MQMIYNQHNAYCIVQFMTLPKKEIANSSPPFRRGAYAIRPYMGRRRFAVGQADLAPTRLPRFRGFSEKNREKIMANGAKR
jgi:hypothetical protein